MSSLRELTQLLAKIAGEVRRHNAVNNNLEDNENASASRAVSSITRSLNSVYLPSSDCKILDAALSLMCQKTTEVCSVRIKLMLQTLISVLCSSVSCKIFHLGREGPEILKVGSSIFFGDCEELMSVSADVLESLDASNGFAYDLLHAVLRTVVFSSVSRAHCSLPSICDEGIEISGISRTVTSRLMHILSNKIYPSSHETPLRSFFWYIDPLILKDDISELLREIMQRPFLSLKAEFYNRPSWRSMILCLVTSPTMFRQASTLLHTWFLLTGLSIVFELHVALVSAVLDMVSRPMSWGVSMELGLKFPSAHAYFPNNFQDLLGVLNGSISCNNFVDFVQKHIKLAAIGSEASLDPNSCNSFNGLLGHETILGPIDNYSTWSMLIKFPTWFYFATTLFFYYKDIQASFISEIISNDRNFNSYDTNYLNEAAVSYLSFVLSPVRKGNSDSLAEQFLKLSWPWSLVSRASSSHEQCSSLGAHNKVSLHCSKKLRINKNNDDKLVLSAHRCSFASLALWLKEFDCVFKSWSKPFLKEKSVDSTSSKNLFIKIPLGILMLHSRSLNAKACELILHYANTGEIMQCGESQIESFNYNEHEFAFYGDGKRKRALDGACLVFSVFDIIDEISFMLFDCEATRLDFICHLKGKVCKYLLRCVKTMLYFSYQQLIEDKNRVGLHDLFKRLVQWKQLGRDVFEECEEFDDMLVEFKEKFKIE